MSKNRPSQFRNSKKPDFSKKNDFGIRTDYAATNCNNLVSRFFSAAKKDYFE